MVPSRPAWHSAGVVIENRFAGRLEFSEDGRRAALLRLVRSESADRQEVVLGEACLGYDHAERDVHALFLQLCLDACDQLPKDVVMSLDDLSVFARSLRLEVHAPAVQPLCYLFADQTRLAIRHEQFHAAVWP